MESELCRLSYEDSGLLDSLDLEELPVLLTDLLADLDPDPGIFHEGCVIAEVIAETFLGKTGKSRGDFNHRFGTRGVEGGLLEGAISYSAPRHKVGRSHRAP